MMIFGASPRVSVQCLCRPWRQLLFCNQSSITTMPPNRSHPIKNTEKQPEDARNSNLSDNSMSNAPPKLPFRPISPHLSIYQPQLTWLMSIGHRITGAYLSTGKFCSQMMMPFNANLFFFPLFKCCVLVPWPMVTTCLTMFRSRLPGG